MKTAPKTVRIINLGCSKNQVDAENLLGEFGRAGYKLATEDDAPSVSVVNTCGFIETAKEESIQEILEAAHRKAPGEKLIVAGCLSQRYRAELEKDIPEVDLFVGTYHQGELLQRLGLTSASPSDCAYGQSPRQLMGEEPHHAFLKIAEGCNRVCSFCAIPGMRGKQVSRGIQEIVEEARQLEKWGIREISLIAQDLTYYGREGKAAGDLESLLRRLLSETSIPWIRLMYAYPAFLTDGLLEIIATEPRICSYLDMPIQHASTRILRAMRRNYTGDKLRQLLQKVRSNVPGLSLRTTVLVGFPGETEEDFSELLSLMEEIRFNRLGGFTYSDEEGTHAFTLSDARVPQEIMQERLERVMTLQQQISLEENEKLLGRELDVIIDGVAEGDSHQFVGRTEWDAPEVDNRVLIFGREASPGEIRKVTVTDAWEYDLEGVLKEEA